jgi:hypothetical protein
MPLAPGERLGPFEIVAPLGAGNMGEVYRARDLRLDRSVAVKVLLPALAADAGAVARFATEARAVAALSHPNIVALYDVGQDGSNAYVVTELLEGDTLRDRLGSGPLPVRKAVDYARQIADAIAAAHQRGIVHRDLKPENVFVTPGGRVKVLDFGIAQMTTSAAPVVPADAVTIASTPDAAGQGGVFGSVGYIAPEQVRGAAVDHRADIFALGCMLYEMLTGRRPFSGATAADSVAALLNSEAPPLGDASAAWPQLERIVRRCLEKSPDERFQSARDLAFALDAVLSDDGRGGGKAMGAPGRPRWVLPAVVAALVLVAIAAALVLAGGRATPRAVPEQVVRFGIAATTTWSDAASISPDGRYIIYTGGSSSVTPTASAASASGGRSAGSSTVSGRFWLRALDSLESVRLSDTEAAVPLFFWSPDSRLVGYSGGNSLVVRELPDGAPRPLTDLPSAPQGMGKSRRPARGDG